MQVNNVDLTSLHSQTLPHDSPPARPDKSDDPSNTDSLSDLIDSEALVDLNPSKDTMENQDGSPSINEFITTYAQIDIVSRPAFAHAWPSYADETSSFEIGIGNYSTRENSRNR